MLELLSGSLMIAMGQKPFQKPPVHREHAGSGQREARHRWMPSLRSSQD